MSVTAVKMFLWFYSVVATGSVKSARQIEAKKIFLEKWLLRKGKFFSYNFNSRITFQIFCT